MRRNRQAGDGQGPDSRCDIGRGLTFGNGAVKHLDLLALARCTGQDHGGFHGVTVRRNVGIAGRAFHRGDRRGHHGRDGEGSCR
ncbi:hypothetical protein D3C71_1723240 [compost metagenome]